MFFEVSSWVLSLWIPSSFCYLFFDSLLYTLNIICFLFAVLRYLPLLKQKTPGIVGGKNQKQLVRYNNYNISENKLLL